MQKSAQLEDRIFKCDQILSRNPDSLVFAALSDVYRKRGDLAKAFHICSRGLKLHPDYGPGHLVMARINMERGMYSEAERELALAEQADGKTRGTELLLAQILIRKDQTREARKILDRLKITDPENQVVAELLRAEKQKTEPGKQGFDVMTAQERWRIEKVVDLRDAMGYLKSLPGVSGALMVGENGLVMESKLTPFLKKELVGAVATSITGRVKEGMGGIGFGEYEQVLIEAENLALWIIRFKDQACVLCCTPDAALGALKVRMGELLEHLSVTVW
jgi:predicted regulator of Ras-like GTPase activity (Roadblock/LC7/MglB family)/lipopolysaccharide biosynthesis regulator YciM